MDDCELQWTSTNDNDKQRPPWKVVQVTIYFHPGGATNLFRITVKDEC